MPPEQFKTNWTAIGVVGGFVISVAGWFVVHWLTKRREWQRHLAAVIADKERRKRDFLAFLVPWRADIASAVPTAMATVLNPGRAYWWPVYQDRRADFLAAVQTAKDCCSDAIKFDTLTKRITAIKERDERESKKADCLEAIDELIGLVENC